MAHKQRVAYLDYLRLVAILGVITIHVATSLNFYRQDYASLNWQILSFWDGLSRFCVPVFIMISGAVFLNPDFDLSWEKLFKKYLRRIVVSYLIWQLIYCGWYYFAKGGDLVTVAKFLIGSYDHLWYLPMIAGLYLVTPLLRPLARRRQLLEYYLSLALLFAWLLPTGLDLIRLWPNPPKHMADALAAFKRLLGKLDLQTVMGFGGYYMAGYYFSQVHMSKRNLYFVQALGLLGAGATIGLSGWLTAKAGHLRLTLYSYNSFFVLLESSAVFLSLQTLKPRLWSEEVLGELAGSVMGIYLLHPLLIYYWGKTPVWQLVASNSAWLPGLVILIFASSLAIVWLLRRSRFLARWLL